MALAGEMKLLVFNAGSSSLKFHLFEAGRAGVENLYIGKLERVADMRRAVATAFAELGPTLAGETVAAVGHRFVHGGDRYFDATVIDRPTLGGLEALSHLAPLHMPHSLECYRGAVEVLPEALQVACFDTAFHRTMPPEAFLYALPERYLLDKKIRRYGFHGISHQWVTERYAAVRGKAGRVICCHLGNGCSVTAVRDGLSVDTSMGFTPLEGLIMGTRCGDIDAGAILHLILREGEDAAKLEMVLNEESGLLALSGLSNDMRDLETAAGEGKAGAKLAIEAFCYRLRKQIGAYFAAMDGVDALLFTGGIGEHDSLIRAKVCDGLSAMGIRLDAGANNAAKGMEARIGTGGVEVWVIPTNEELLIAGETARLFAEGIH